MIFVEGGWFPNKTMLKEEYKLSMYPLILYILQHSIIPQLKRMHNPLSTLGEIYILTGGDYISFFRTSK